MSGYFLRCAFAALILVLVSPGAFAASDWSGIDNQMLAEFPDDGPGAIAIAAVNGKPVYAKAFGRASLELNVPLAPDNVVRIASLTKQFTSVAILKLVEQHKLALDDRLAARWPQCPTLWRDITLRQLLSQTSGISGDLSPLYSRLAEDMTPDELLGVYAKLPLASAPGTSWRYSNVNYWILGKLIETVSGARYADFVMRNVLAPGMTQTRYGDHDAIIAGRVPGYEQGPSGGWINARYFSSTLGYSAGGFVSSPRDMALWYDALGRGQIVSRDLLMTALQEAKTTDGKPTGYALGWYVTHIDGDLVASHGGSTFGFESYAYWMPSRGLFAGVFENRSDAQGEPEKDAKAVLVRLMETRP